MRNLTQRVVVNTVLAGGANVATVNGNVIALKDGGNIVLPPYDKSLASVSKISSQVEIPAVALLGMKADGTLITVANSTRYSALISNTERKDLSKKSVGLSFNYTTPSESSTLKMIIDVLKERINNYLGLHCTAYTARKFVVTGAGTIPTVGKTVFQGVSLAAATWTAQVVYAYAPSGTWAADAAAVLVVANETGTWSTKTAVKDSGAVAITTTATEVITANAGLAIIDSGNYYTGEFRYGQNSFGAYGGFADASGTSWIQTSPATYQVGIGTQMLLSLSTYSRDKRDLFEGHEDGVYWNGTTPVAGSTYDLVLLRIANSTPDQNQETPVIATDVEIYVNNSNATNVTNLVAALHS